MTLEELMAEFPHGSRWRHKPETGYYETLSAFGAVRCVIGWQPTGDMWAVVFGNDDYETNSWDANACRKRLERIPDPVPCPIHEPTVVRSCVYGRTRDGGIVEDRTRWGTGGTGTAITLHPAEPGATEGRYTWEQPT